MKDFCLTDEITWIPVQEELPEYLLPVLFWKVGHNPGCYVGWYSNKKYDGKNGRWFDIYGNSIFDGVTHWSPLPKGPDCTLQIGLKIENEY